MAIGETLGTRSNILTLKSKPPSVSEILKDASVVKYQEPFYSDPKDVPKRAKVFGGVEFQVPCYDVSTLPEVNNSIYSTAPMSLHKEIESVKSGCSIITPVAVPPTVEQALKSIGISHTHPQQNITVGVNHKHTELHSQVS
jgi:hypothetical protein